MRCGVAAMMWTVFRCETPRRNIFSTELPLAAASRHDLCAKWGEVLVPKRRNADVHQGFPRCRYVAGQLSWRNATSPAGALRRWRRMFRGRFGYWRNAPSLVPHGVRGTVAALRQNPGRARGRLPGSGERRGRPFASCGGKLSPWQYVRIFMVSKRQLADRAILYSRG